MLDTGLKNIHAKYSSLSDAERKAVQSSIEEAIGYYETINSSFEKR